MSDLTFAKATRKNGTIPSFSPMQLRSGSTRSDTSDKTTSPGSGNGYDFSSIQIQSDQQSCQIASPRTCPFGGACHACPVKVQTKLAINKPGDEFEQEADRVAEQVMRMPDPLNQETVPAMSSSAQAVQRKCAQCEDEEARLQKKETAGQAAASGHSFEAPPIVHDVLRTTGQPLDSETRAFMEPRFGHDFSQVRVHTDAKAAESARAVNAFAYTVGRDVVFGSGQHVPGTHEGRRLISHELAHVVQQRSGAISRHELRRAKIPYRQITWADFTGAAPANPAYDALTASGSSSTPKWSATPTLKETGKECKAGGKPEKEMTATISPPASVFDTLIAEMDQDASWVIARYKNTAAYCAGEKATECSKSFDKQAADAAADCDNQKTECEKYFKTTKDPGKYSIDGTSIVAKNIGECTALAASCKTEAAKTFEFALGDTAGTKATTKKDCSGKAYQAACVAQEKVANAYLLKHEQGHFDISNVMVAKAKKDLQASAAAGAFAGTGTGCGKQAAIAAATEKAQEAMSARVTEWVAKNTEAQDDYDTETDHSKDTGKQSTWEALIKAGLTAYTLKPLAPATAAAPGSAAPTAKAPATAPVKTPGTPPANPGVSRFNTSDQ